MKRIAMAVILVLVCNAAWADNGYVSPETYAVNEADMEEMFRSIMSQPVVNAPSAKSGKEGKEKKYYIDDTSNTIKAKLREIRYNMQEPHHGQLHEIKLNTPYKQQKLNEQNS
ncbi:hypothetical protein J6E39_02770 [bacterium]|nr:hypothetical protein [bacterium]